MESVTVIIISICAAVVAASIATIMYAYRLDAITEKDAEELVSRVSTEAEIDILHQKITVIHGRMTNLEKRIEPIGFQEVLTKHADEIAVICCREYSKLFQDGHNERRDADNNG